MESILLLLVVAACPLMMVWCMRSMRGHGKSDTTTTTSTDEAARLRQEIAELRDEIDGRRSHLGPDR